MSWRDKVQAMREGENSQKCLNPSLPKLPKPSSVSFGTPPPTHFQEKTGCSGHEATVSDPATPALESPASTQPSAPTIPAKPPKQTFMENADTWRELDRAYQAHHFKCPICKAAGLGYGLRCGAGAALWTAYSESS